MNVLLIEDDFLARSFLEELFQKLNCHVSCACDGEDGWGQLILFSGKIDLICLDWDMPKMNGIDFVKRLRNFEKTKEIAVLMCTGKNDLESIKEALACGVNEFLMKPYVKEMVVEKVRMIGLEM